MRYPRVVVAGVMVAGTAVATFALAIPALASPHHGGRGRTLHGVVSSVGSGFFVLTEHNQKTQTIDTNSSTRYYETGDPTKPTGVTTGEHVTVTLVRHHGFHRFPFPTSTTTSSTSSSTTSSTTTSSTTSSTTTSTDPDVASVDSSTSTTPPARVAKTVDITLASVFGKVTSLITGGFIVTGHGQTTHKVFTSSSMTEYIEPGQTPTGVTVGEIVAAFGNIDTTAGGLDALFVHILPLPVSMYNTTSTTSSSSSTTDANYVPQGGPPTDGEGHSPLPAQNPSAPWGSNSQQQAVAGVVKSVTQGTGGAGTIVVEGHNGSTSTTVAVNSSTVIYVHNEGGGSPQTGSLSMVASGDDVVALGTTANGTFTASKVFVNVPGGQGQGQGQDQGQGQGQNWDHWPTSSSNGNGSQGDDQGQGQRPAQQPGQSSGSTGSWGQGGNQSSGGAGTSSEEGGTGQYGTSGQGGGPGQGWQDSEGRAGH